MTKWDVLVVLAILLTTAVAGCVGYERGAAAKTRACACQECKCCGCGR